MLKTLPFIGKISGEKTLACVFNASYKCKNMRLAPMHEKLLLIFHLKNEQGLEI